MKIFDHTINAPNRTPKFEKTSALSVPSVVDEQTRSGSDISLTNSAFTQFRTSNYTWGLDLSQTIQGAGGVSGLLSLDKGTATYYYTYDANGNVSELIDTAGVVKAHYEYSPFGKVVHKSGPLTDKSPFQFSTKYLDNETQLYYYGYRYYNPENGRWLNRDPIQEDGGINIYAFVENQTIGSIDVLGEDKLNLKFMAEEFSFKDSAAEGFPTSVKNAKELIKKIKDKLGDKFDKTGKCGNCLRKVTLIAHSGLEGYFNFGNVDEDSYRTATGAWSSGDEALMKELTGLFCDDGEVILAQCSAGAGDDGTKSLQDLAKMWGVPISAPVEDIRVSWSGKYKKSWPGGTIGHWGSSNGNGTGNKKR